MSNLRLGVSTHDLVIGEYKFEQVDSVQEDITQRLKIKLLFFREEFFLNLNYGIPYFQEIFIKGVYKEDLDDIFRVAILSEDGVQEILKYSSVFDRSSRQFTVETTIRTDNGEILPLSLIL